MSVEKPLRLLIVAGDPLARSALATTFDSLPRCQVLGLSNPSTAVDYIAELQEEAGLDVVVWDGGWEAGSIAASDFSSLDVGVLVLLQNEDQVEDAWAAGARAMVRRDAAPELLAAALAAAGQGLIVIENELAPSFLSLGAGREEGPVEELTPRELQVLQLLAEGLTNKGIAGALGISPHTVKFHVNGILNKLNAQSRTEAVVRATKLGLLAL